MPDQISSRVETKIERLETLFGQMESEQSSFRTHWQDLSNYILPRRSKFFITDTNKGDARNQKIIDSTATLAARDAANGMMGRFSSPSMPWMELTLSDADLIDGEGVRDWLSQSSDNYLDTLGRSNYYTEKFHFYQDFAVFGTAATLYEEHETNVFHARTLKVGSYYLANDNLGRARVFSRKFQMTVRQLVEEFGVINEKGEVENWDKFSFNVKHLWEEGFRESWVEVAHFITPNEDYDGERLDSKYKRYKSCYYERGLSSRGAYPDYLRNDVFLRESGYDEFPVVVGRAEASDGDVYSVNSFGMMALPDIKELQMMARKAAQAIAKQVNPPLMAPASMRNSTISLIDGKITYVDGEPESKGIVPIHQVNFNLADLERRIFETRQRIKDSFLVDAFRAVIGDQRLERATAAEIREISREKLDVLISIEAKLSKEVFDQEVEILFPMMQRAGIIPPPPPDIEGAPIKVVYVSDAAQAQKISGVRALEGLIGFAGTLAAAKPEVLDKIDGDQMIEDYSNRVRVGPKIIRGKRETDIIREERLRQQQAAAAAAQMEAVGQASKVAKDLSQSDLSSDNVLSRLVR